MTCDLRLPTGLHHAEKIKSLGSQADFWEFVPVERMRNCVILF